MQGREFEPTDEHRRSVRALAGFGIRQDDIATHLGVDPKTLRKHFRDELDRGVIEANAKVAQSLFHLATVDKNVAAAIFWLKARAGWREKLGIEHSTPDGHPLARSAVVNVSITSPTPLLDAESEPVTVTDLRTALNASQVEA